MLNQTAEAIFRATSWEIHSVMKIKVNDCGKRLFALAFFSRRQDRELPGAVSRGLPDYSPPHPVPFYCP